MLAVGTEFNVRRHNDDVTVTVMEAPSTCLNRRGRCPIIRLRPQR